MRRVSVFAFMCPNWKVERQILYCKPESVIINPHMVADLLGSHLWLLDHEPGLCVVGNGLDDLAGHPHHVLQHPSGNLYLRQQWFFCIFWRAGVCWLLLCLRRLFSIYERCLDSSLESCRSKQARYQLGHPSLYTNLASHLPNSATHLPNSATHLPNLATHLPTLS